MNSRIRFILLLILITFFWGATFPLIKVSLQYISPMPFLGFRFLVSALVFVPFILRKKDLLSRESIKYGFWAGFYLMIGYVFQTVGLLYTGAAVSGLITSLYVIILPILSVVYLHYRVRRIVIISSIVAFSGLLLTSTGSFSGPLAWFGDVLTLVCAFAYAFQLAYLSKYTVKVDTYVFSFYQLLVVAVFSFALWPIIPGEHVVINTFVIFSILFTGIFAGSLAIFVMTKSLAVVEPSVAGIIFVGEPIFAVLTSVIFISEKLSVPMIIGGAMMLIAILLVSLSGQRKGNNALEKNQA